MGGITLNLLRNLDILMFFGVEYKPIELPSWFRFLFKKEEIKRNFFIYSSYSSFILSCAINQGHSNVIMINALDNL